ncbi:MAG TPA: SDR family oxidoreductase [Stellaceae bacterium]|nr:SDR family oxidoreductase [Stellaceae bacterium]
MGALDGKKVLVVGGSSGMGEGVAKLAAAAGAKVTIASRNHDKLAAAAKRLGKGVEPAILDATSDAAVAKFFAEGAVWDHVCISAGGGGRGNIKDLDIATAMAAMDAKFWIAFRVAKAATIARDGSLTFVSGGLSQRPAAGASIIAAVNGALERMSVGLALELAPVRVNTVSPGPVDTPMWDRYTPEQKKKFLDGAASHVPLKRVAHPDEIAELVLFFMTNRFVTGTVVPLDGGSSRA